MRTSENIDSIALALVEAQSEFPTILKDSVNKNPKFTSTFASMSTIVEAIRPVLVDRRLAVIQGFAESIIVNADGEARANPAAVAITTRIIHESGEWIESTLHMPVVPAPTKAGNPIPPIGPQQVGSAITYGRRYALAAMLGLVTDEDDDGERAQGRDTTPQPTPAKAGTNTLDELLGGL